MQVDMQTIIFVFLTLSITNPRVVLCFANAQPTTYKNGTNVTQMELPSEFYQDMEHGIFYAIRNRQTQDTKLPFMLIKTYNLGSFSDGTLGLFMVTSSKMSFLRRLEGFGTLRSNIVYFDNGMAYFTIAGGTLFSIDGSTQEINEVKKFTDDPIRWVGEESYLDKFCILQDSMYFAANQTELWKSDGTSKGTIMVEELNDTINSMSVVNDDYLLLAMGSNQILVSDGSSASTILTTEVEAPLLRGWRQSLIEGNRKALFLLNTGVWATEGTPETTIKISNLRGLIYQHVDLADSVGMISMAGGYLFLTDGTQEGTRPLNVSSLSNVAQTVERGIITYRDLDNFGTVSSFQSVVGWLPTCNGRSGFLSSQDGRANVSVWTTNGEKTSLLEAQMPYPTGLARLNEKTMIYRSANEVRMFDCGLKELVLLVQFDVSYLIKSRILFAFDDGTLLLSLQRTADDPLEFWTIRLPEAADDEGESERAKDEESDTNNQDDPKPSDEASAAALQSFGTAAVVLITAMLI